MRYFSLYRRRSNLIDLNWQSGPGSLIAARSTALSYDIQFAVNFDSSFTTFQRVPASGGFASPSAQDLALDVTQFSQSRLPYLTRFIFAPSDYTASFPTLIDTRPLYFRLIQRNTNGTTNAAEACQLILPYYPEPNRAVMLAGNAPSALSITNSQEIQLPGQVNNFQIQNNGTLPLMVAFEPNGPEFTVQPLATGFTNLYSAYPSITQLFVRGSGGLTTFNFMGALRNNQTE